MALPPPPTRVGPPPPSNGVATASPSTPSKFVVTTGRILGAQKVVIYGPGGIGKSTLASLAPKPIFLDVEDSTKRIDGIARIGGIASWNELREALRSEILNDYQTIVIDSVTKAEELAVADTLARVRTEKKETATSVESYGFGKGYQHVYETFLHLLVECDRHVRAGRNVVFVAHACTSKVPNPGADDFIRWEPRLQTTKEGKASIRSRVVEWADHVLFIGYDVAVDEDGKGKGAGTRAIYTKETPTQIAKVREVGTTISTRVYRDEKDGSIWPILLATEGGAR